MEDEFQRSKEAPDSVAQPKFKYHSKTFSNFMQRDKPHPSRALWQTGLNNSVHRSIEDYRLFDGFQHSIRRSYSVSVSVQGSPNCFMEARLRAFRQNVYGTHLTQRANLILSARERIPNFNEKLLNQHLNQQILADVLAFTANLLPNSSTLPNLPNLLAPRTAPAPDEQTAQAEQRSRMDRLYSARSGRLVPPPTRSSCSSRAATAAAAGSLGALANWRNALTPEAIADQKQRLAVELLCQLLHTDDLLVAASWISTASELEKCLLMRLLDLAIQAHLNTVEESDPSTPDRMPMFLIPQPPKTSRPEKLDQRSTPPRFRMRTAPPSRQHGYVLRKASPENDYSRDAYS